MIMLLRAPTVDICLLLMASAILGPAFGARISESNPPPNVIHVQPGKQTLSAAFAQLKGKTGKQVFLLAPGTYYDNAKLKKYADGIVIQGAGGSAVTYKNNKVSIVSSQRGTEEGSALTVHTNNVEVYNIDFINNFGSGKDTQATALTAHGNNQVYGQCSFKSFQDTLYDKEGVHFYDGCYIEGAVDFIFGWARSYYESCDIGIRPSQWHQVITANAAGRPESDPLSIFVLNKPRIFDLGGVATQSTYLGRAWGGLPHVIFQDATFPASLHPDGWDMEAAYKGTWSPKGFYEFPTVRTKHGNLAPRAFTKHDILNTANMP